MLGEFQLLRLLGRGGMAEVYLARQTSLDRPVAVKILRKEVAENPTLLKRFEREARAAAALSHPNIVQVYVVGEDDGIRYIAQEYVEGLNLKEFLQRKGPPDVQVATHFMKQIASALQRAAQEGVVHRDIKPENIMITRKGVVKVADFGLAQLAHPADGPSLELTQVGTTMGTPLYMSPEQVQGQKVDHRSDIYSFGVTCYQLLSGHPPFRGETAVSVALQHVNNLAAPLNDVRPDVPLALVQIIEKMMAKQPDKRYADAGEVARDLKQIIAGLKGELDLESLSLTETGTISVPVQTSVWQRFQQMSTRGKLLGYLAAVVLTLVAGTILGRMNRLPDPLASPPARKTHIPAQRTAADQFETAERSFRDDPAAWQAVIDGFPDDLDYNYRAQERLAMLYLAGLKYDRAGEVFTRLSQMDGGGLNAEYRRRGLAGLAVIAALKNDPQECRRRLKQIDGPDQKFEDGDDSRLADYVRETRRRLKI